MTKPFILIGIILYFFNSTAILAGPPIAAPPAAVPTLSNLGIVGMIIALGIAAWIRSNKDK